MDAQADTARFFFDGVERDYQVRFTGVVGNTGSIYTAESIFDRVGIAGPVYWNQADLVDGVVDSQRCFRHALPPSNTASTPTETCCQELR